MPETARRWREEGEQWLAAKRRQRKYEGRNGDEARRFLRKCGVLLKHGPEQVTEEELWFLADRIMGKASKTKRYYASILGSFLSSRRNWIVQETGFISRFPKVTALTPVAPPEDRDRVLNGAQGEERVVMALLGAGRRPVEVARARVEDFNVADPEPTMGVRTKGGHGEVTHRIALTPSLARELRWYLPVRAKWGSDANSDSGHLLCRRESGNLLGVSVQWVRRRASSAGQRTGVAWPMYAYRRGVATALRELGADFEDITEVLCQDSYDSTRSYVSALLKRRRVASVLRLLDEPKVAI